ncbi:hypothetical protein BCR36DRAFT_369323 [Piromyces finnis]|uniref:Uncharacterized protein n=1 Tax=Piromyces finnis TaxID=1754191 RepID=A0A1Y1VC21_9FUNG|nr:hypothetical protein BCR36DRAFT_369323 [Piromyces finnis]|eukprot:ORX52524.1 hypothetical protein BCR36DRAFT_369323 [Piromyces finnis]
MFSVVRIFLIYILYFNLAIKSIYAEKFIDVTTENQFKDALSKKTSDEIKINIKNNIIVNDIEKLNINSSISKITIKGESLSKSKLTFTHQNGGLYFDKNIQEINILDITLISSMLFNNNENIKFENVIIDDGSYIFNMTSTKENNVTITNSRINPPEIKKSFLMEFYQSNLYIDHTQFYGNKNLLKGVILMRNEKEFLASGKFHLTNTLFSGGYETKFLDVNSVKEIRFSNSEMKESFGKNELYIKKFILIISLLLKI